MLGVFAKQRMKEREAFAALKAEYQKVGDVIEEVREIIRRRLVAGAGSFL